MGPEDIEDGVSVSCAMTIGLTWCESLVMSNSNVHFLAPTFLEHRKNFWREYRIVSDLYGLQKLINLQVKSNQRETSNSRMSMLVWEHVTVQSMSWIASMHLPSLHASPTNLRSIPNRFPNTFVTAVKRTLFYTANIETLFYQKTHILGRLVMHGELARLRQLFAQLFAARPRPTHCLFVACAAVPKHSKTALKQLDAFCLLHYGKRHIDCYMSCANPRCNFLRNQALLLTGDISAMNSEPKTSQYKWGWWREGGGGEMSDVIDIGCGTGAFFVFLASEMKGHCGLRKSYPSMKSITEWPLAETSESNSLYFKIFQSLGSQPVNKIYASKIIRKLWLKKTNLLRIVP